jgi:hypothetical protein
MSNNQAALVKLKNDGAVNPNTLAKYSKAPEAPSTAIDVVGVESSPETREEYIRRLERENETLRSQLAMLEAKAKAALFERQTRVEQLMAADLQAQDQCMRMRQQRDDAQAKLKYCRCPKPAW